MKYLAVLLVLVLGSASASAGTITGTATIFNPEIRVQLAGYQDWAVWNVQELTAGVTKGVGEIDYTLAAITPFGVAPLSNEPAAAIFNTGAGFYAGGLSYTSTPNVDGLGFSLTVPAEYANGHRIDLWILANGPVGVLVEAISGGDTSTPLMLDPFRTYALSFTAAGLQSPLAIQMTNVGAFSSAQGGMSFGAAAIVPIPEPQVSYFLGAVAVVAVLYLLTVSNCLFPPPK